MLPRLKHRRIRSGGETPLFEPWRQEISKSPCRRIPGEFLTRQLNSRQFQQKCRANCSRSADIADLKACPIEHVADGYHPERNWPCSTWTCSTSARKGASVSCPLTEQKRSNAPTECWRRLGSKYCQYIKEHACIDKVRQQVFLCMMTMKK